MAIYSLHHTAIGKTTQARPHTAAAHVKYISRPQAMRHYETARFPTKPGAAARLLQREEDQDRANARVADKLMLALPRELSPAQRVDLVRGFAEEITEGRAPWLAAFHDKGKDARNPHCHLLIRDRDAKTGRRVIRTSEPGSTERFRELWERHANDALQRAGLQARIDRRTLKAQGIDRQPTIHEGPKAREMDARGAAPRSRHRRKRNGVGAKSPVRRINYKQIDNGISRPAYNRALRQKETVSDYWSAVDEDNRRREFVELGYNVVPFGDARGNGLQNAGAERNEPVSPLAPSAKNRTEWSNVSLRHQSNDAGQARQHRLSAGQRMPERDLRARYEALLEEAEYRLGLASASLNNAWDQSYRTPDRAREKLIAFWKVKGEQAAIDQLTHGPQRFGRRPGSILSVDRFKSGAKRKQRDATAARQHLPYMFNEYRGAANEYLTIRRAIDDLQARDPGFAFQRTPQSERAKDVSGPQTTPKDPHSPDKESRREPGQEQPSSQRTTHPNGRTGGHYSGHKLDAGTAKDRATKPDQNPGERSQPQSNHAYEENRRPQHARDSTAQPPTKLHEQRPTKPQEERTVQDPTKRSFARRHGDELDRASAEKANSPSGGLELGRSAERQSGPGSFSERLTGPRNAPNRKDPAEVSEPGLRAPGPSREQHPTPTSAHQMPQRQIEPAKETAPQQPDEPSFSERLAARRNDPDPKDPAEAREPALQAPGSRREHPHPSSHSDRVPQRHAEPVKEAAPQQPARPSFSERLAARRSDPDRKEPAKASEPALRVPGPSREEPQPISPSGHRVPQRQAEPVKEAPRQQPAGPSFSERLAEPSKAPQPKGKSKDRAPEPRKDFEIER